MHRWLPLVACGFLLAAAPAQAGPLAVANTAWPGSPCAGKVNVTFDRTLYDRLGFVGAAAGIRVAPDGSWTRVSCKVLLDTGYWRRSSPREQCRVLAHESAHLAYGPVHIPWTILATDHSGPFPPCDRPSTKERRMTNQRTLQ